MTDAARPTPRPEFVPVDLSKSMTDAEFAKLRSIVYAQTGISIGDSRRSMLVTRLRPRLRALGLDDYKSYAARVAQDPVEMQELTDRVTTNETYFYRTPRVWAHFRDVFLPAGAARAKGRPLRVWSAAASTGEEAHTAAVFLEEVRAKTAGFDYAVLGTDISTRVLEAAKAGRYQGRATARFLAEQPELFGRHMRGSEEAGWTVAPEIAKRIRFRQHNLLQPLSNAPQFDAVFLRNVLIYFSAADQEAILRHVRRVIHPEGVLFIGESETLKHIDTGFEQVEPIIYRPVLRVPGGGA
ncbi:CheR family methyltransferase [Rhodovulum sp. DZ06]|uniref:CheR family methyltransferase n=1 Tax=Rhodovulum sp. DZ06 TaxID=3425126 RepID=UPI003D33D94E